MLKARQFLALGLLFTQALQLAHALPGRSRLRAAPAPVAVAGRYLVRVDRHRQKEVVAQRLRKLADTYGDHRQAEAEANKPVFIESIGTVVLSISNSTELETLRHDPTVAFVTQESRISLPPITPRQISRIGDGEQVIPETVYSWGVDRVNQRALPLDNYGLLDNCSSTGVDVYILDTGIDVNHPMLEGRARFFYSAYSTKNDGHGHGTHLAGIVTGKDVGLSRATVHAVKVIGNDGYGFTEHMLLGLQAVLNGRNKARRAIVSISADVFRMPQDVDDLINALTNQGVLVVAAGGNIMADYPEKNPCDYLPGNPNVLAVGASTDEDKVAPFTLQGGCVDVFAPGENIVSLAANTQGTTWMSGSSQATPFVAATAALYITRNPTATPAQITAAVIAQATPNKFTKATGWKTGTPNRLLFSSFDLLPCMTNPTPRSCPQNPNMFRLDNRCGSAFPLPNGQPSECDASSRDSYCCSPQGTCGPATGTCVDFQRKYGCGDQRPIPSTLTPTFKPTTTVRPPTTTVKPPQSTTASPRTPTPKATTTAAAPRPSSPPTVRTCQGQNPKLFRKDMRCGPLFKTDGQASQCNGLSANRYCVRGWCSRFPATGAIDYRTFCTGCPRQKSARIRADGLCGPKFRGLDGMPGECNANSKAPCCSSDGRCGASPNHCECQGCVNYRPMTIAPYCTAVRH